MKTILRGNLEWALQIAIQTRSQDEKDSGYTKDSAFVAGLREVLEGLRNGEYIEVK